MPIKPKMMEKIVLEHGFIRDKGKGKGSHRRYKHPDGRTTEIPFHSNEIRPATERKILQQIRKEK